MSLKKQLYILVGIMIFVVFCGTLAISLKNTQEYLNKQLKVHAQDTATSLGLSLTSVIAQQDMAQVESMLSVIFDRGYYRRIYLKQIHGQLIHDKEVDIWVEHVPDWFVQLLPLATPVMETEISVQWKPAAILGVSVHPGYAYEELWNLAKYNLSWMTALTLMIYAVVFLGMNRLLIPLDKIEKQALAISQKDFVRQTTLPRTRELRNVVMAMNAMSDKVEKNFAAQADLTRKYQDLAYHDPLTGFLNKAGFVLALEGFVANKEEFTHGAFFIVHLSDIDSVNRQQGYAAGDEQLRSLANVINKITDNERIVCARIAGAEFGVLIKNPLSQEAEECIKQILAEYSQHNRDALCKVHCGLTIFDAEKNTTVIFSEADTALRQAQTGTERAWHVYAQEESGIAVRTASQWKRLLEMALAQDDFELYTQPIHFYAGGGEYRELLLRLSDEGQLIPAGTFMPMADYYSLSERIDRMVIEKALNRLADDPEMVFAVNISDASLTSGGFINWLHDRLQSAPSAQRIILEIRESTLLRQSEIRDRLNALARYCGGVGLEHFGARLPDFGYLRHLRFRYLKVAGCYIHDLEHNEANRFYLQILLQMARGLDIPVLAEAVETEATASAVKALNMDGAQGYYYGKPAPLD